MNAALSVKFEELEQEGIWGLGSGRGAQWPLPGLLLGTCPCLLPPAATVLILPTSSSLSDQDHHTLGIGGSSPISADFSVLSALPLVPIPGGFVQTSHQYMTADLELVLSSTK